MSLPLALPRPSARPSRLALALLAAFAVLPISRAANFTWDPTDVSNGATIDAGSGTWDTTGTNLFWNNAGTNVAWANNNSAQFAGADAPEGTEYTVTLGSAVTVASTNNALWFANSGYVLTSDTSRTITTPQITVSSGKTATLSGNISVTPAATGALTLAGFGTLTLTEGARLAPNANNISLNHGHKLTLATGGVATTSAQIVLGAGTANATATEIKIDGGSLGTTNTSTSSASNIVVANVGSGTATANVTLSSGSISNSSPIGGLRFGPASGGAATVSGTMNLDGGTLTTGRIYEGTGSPLATVSTFNFNGGTLKAVANTTNAANFIAGIDNAFVKSGGALIDTNGASITIAQPLLTDASSLGGGLTKLGAGTLTLTGANTYTGNTTVSDGTLAVNAPYASLTATTVEAGAHLRIVSGTGASTLPSLTLAEGSAVDLDLGLYDSGRVSSASFTTLDAAGNFTVGLSGTNIPVGSYTVLSYAAKSGAGVPSVGTLPPGVTANLIDNGSSLVIEVLTPQLYNYHWSAGSGVWDLSAPNWTSLTYVEGRVVTFPDLAGDNTVTLDAARSPFSVSIQNNLGNTYTFTGASITGTASVSKTGTGVATFTSSNSYTGSTTVSGGGILVSADGALGTVDGSTTLASGTLLGLTGGITYSTAEPIIGSGVANTVALGSLAVQRGVIQSVSGHNTFAGNLTLSAGGATRIGAQDGASLTLSGTITPASGVTDAFILFRTALDGDFVTLSGTGNSWDQPTTLFAGAATGNSGVRLGIDNGLPTNVAIVGGGNSTAAGTTFDLNGFNQSLPGLVESNGHLQITNLKADTTSTLTLDTATLNFTNVPGVATVNLTRITDTAGKVALVKKGTFTQTLTGAQSYTGDTTIEAGTLAFTGATSVGATKFNLVAGSTLNVSGILASDFTMSAGLSGSGTVNAPGKILVVGTVFQPGALALTGTPENPAHLTLAADTVTTLVASGSPETTSAVTVPGTLTFQGTLAITEAEGFDFSTGTSFTFATAASVTTGLTGVTVNGSPLTESTPDVWTASIGGLDYTFNEATATLAVSGGVVITPLKAWRDLYFPGEGNDGTGIGALDQDPDFDGLNNLLEYATGTVPTAANSSGVTSGTADGKLTLTFNRANDPKLHYDVKGRNDLSTGVWTTVTAANNPSTGGTTPVTVVDEVTIDQQPKRFLRLEVTIDP